MEALGSYLFGHLLGAEASLQDGIAQEICSAAAEAANPDDRFDKQVGQGYPVVIHAVDAQQAEDGALDGDRGMQFNEVLHVAGDGAGRGAGFSYFRLVENQFL